MTDALIYLLDAIATIAERIHKRREKRLETTRHLLNRACWESRNGHPEEAKRWFYLAMGITDKSWDEVIKAFRSSNYKWDESEGKK